MKIIVEDVEDAAFEIDDIEPSDTVETLKKRIEQKSHISTSRQKLLYKCKALEDKNTLQQELVNDGATIYLVVTIQISTIHLTIENEDGTTFEINDLLAAHTVGDIKEKIREKTDIPVNEQILMYEGTELNKDLKTINDSNICDNAVIKVMKSDDRITVILKDIEDKEYIITNLKDTDTFQLLRDKLWEQTQNDPNEFKFLLKGKELKDCNNKKLKDLDIKDATVIQLTARFTGGEKIYSFLCSIILT